MTDLTHQPDVEESLPTTETFQARVRPWMLECFGPVIPFDRVERGDRLLEEVFELLQSGAYDPSRVAALRDYVWARPVGDPPQEAGGVMVTMAAYCNAFGLDMHAAGETELARIWTKVETIRAKQAAKPTGSALPVAAAIPDVEGVVERLKPSPPMAPEPSDSERSGWPETTAEYVAALEATAARAWDFEQDWKYQREKRLAAEARSERLSALVGRCEELRRAARAALIFYDRAELPHMPGEVKILDDLSSALLAELSEEGSYGVATPAEVFAPLPCRPDGQHSAGKREGS